MTTAGRVIAGATAVGAVLSVSTAAISVFNAVTVPRLSRATDSDVHESIVVCVPARNEQEQLPLLIADLRAQRRCRDLRILILDDGSSDDTLAAARAAAGDDARVHVVESCAEPPPGWTGKAAACRTLAGLAFEMSDHLDAIVFVDADVRLAEDAIAAAASTLRRYDAALVCPWPKQISESVVEHLVQPLLGFSWMSTLPIRLANGSLRPSTTVSCGQFMMFDAAAYRDIGGHESVAASVTEDLDIARALRRSGRGTILVSGAGLVECRMYDGVNDLRAGYSRWLWNAFGGTGGSIAVLSAVSVMYLLPPVAALVGSGAVRRWGRIGYGAAVLSRLAAAQVESADMPGRSTDVLRCAVESSAHPLSVAGYLWLTIDSHRSHRRGNLMWKQRPLIAEEESPAIEGRS
ncbi:glycosyltransferase family A protein [Rhodococcus sp. BP22]|uniref:glycosyltransferase n=1 Tax=Rhodococcus sp. BP22 TaxID=2758566 RepID=UPI0028F6FD4B|nr:glycosyltransferase family A protein [Rhodococcus sp. BP22]